MGCMTCDFSNIMDASWLRFFSCVALGCLPKDGDYLNIAGWGSPQHRHQAVSFCRGYEGIIFLATNRPFDLDEAMYRRITSVFTSSALDETGDGEGM